MEMKYLLIFMPLSLRRKKEKRISPVSFCLKTATIETPPRRLPDRGRKEEMKILPVIRPRIPVFWEWAEKS
jgi:hypothetical protein